MEKRHLLPILLATAVVFGGTGLAVARVPPTTGGSIHWTPLDPAALISRTAVLPTRPFSPAPFRVAGYTIRTLAWGDLPLNGLSLMRLATPPDSDRDGIPYKTVDGRRYYSPGNIASDGIRFVDSYVRTGNTGYYDLVHRTQLPHYHEIHVWQLRDLAAISGDAYFRQLSAALAADYP